MAAAEFLSPETAGAGPVGQQQHPGQAAWRAVVGWLGFLLQILLQIVRGTPSSWAHLLSFLGLHHPLLSAAPPQPSTPSPSVAFVRLPSEAPADASSTGPPPPPPSLRRLTVVLDLDETLVCAYESSSLPAALRAEAVEAGLHSFDMECISAEKASCIFLDIKDAEGRQRVNRVTVFERPGLHEFLQRTSEFADLILFTAGLEGYAKPLVDRIDAHNRFCHRLYRPSTVTTEYREHVKDLSCLSKDFHRIVLVDNNPYSFLLQPLNGIPCLTFSAGQPVDDQLMGVIFPLLKHLSLQNDVRPALYETFHMPEWFQRHGIPQIDQAA
uniref:FCP1 homology domain-containing protein n=1 Tax=Oryza meridionalis TaxID=40149 RepID=A0A0E0DSQ1_9ORYZ